MEMAKTNLASMSIDALFDRQSRLKLGDFGADVP
jgi:hypothetical protein